MGFGRLSERGAIRAVVLPVFSRLNPGDVTIRHAWTGDGFRIHSFRHRGYWFHGRNRERETMWLFAELIGAGDHVIEVGAHVGFMSTFFAKLVGSGGRVTVFEPGPNNLPYLRANVGELRNVGVRTEAVSDSDGTAEFHLEDLTGQNNSLVADYQHLAANQTSAHVKAHVTTIEVPTVQLDSCSGLDDVTFIKIDVEGAELGVLRGATSLLEHARPGVMVEVTENHAEVSSLLRSLGYVLFTPDGIEVEGVVPSGNTFALSADQHGRQLQGIGVRQGKRWTSRG